MPLHVSSTCAHHQDVKIALHSVSYRCDDNRGCVMQFWPPDDEQMCSKHVEAWNKTYCETNFVHQVGLNTEINILRCTVSKTSKNGQGQFTSHAPRCTSNNHGTLFSVGRDSSFGIATGYGLDGPAIKSWWRRGFPHLSKPALGPTQPPVQWVPGLFRG